MRELDFFDTQLAELDREIAHRLGVPSGPRDPDPSSDQPATQQTAEQIQPAPEALEPTQCMPSLPTQPESPRPLSQAQVIRILDEVTGINVRIGQIVVAELGTVVDRFPTEAHLCSWVGLCPAAKISAGKRLSNTTGKGNRWSRQALIEAAQAAARSN